tara:strand:+ start:100 stop:717 length:618 start_codon:yes stop_codon:yes gene_type:complete
MTNAFNHSIYTSSQSFPSELCKLTIKTFEDRNKINPSKTYGNEQMLPLSRTDEQIYLDDLDKDVYVNDLDLYNEMGDLKILQGVNHYLDIAIGEYLQIFESLQNVCLRSIRQKVQKTTKGGGYHVWHHEQMTPETCDRVLAWTIYLNDVEEGGETEFLYQSQRIKPVQGKISIFPAHFNYAHRGNPPLTGDKYIITGWYTLTHNY